MILSRLVRGLRLVLSWAGMPLGFMGLLVIMAESQRSGNYFILLLLPLSMFIFLWNFAEMIR